jgi:hypothetical protein
VTRRAIAITVALAALLLAAAADASKVRYGSDLKAPANKRETHGADSAFWAKAFPDGRQVTASAKGQITTIKVKGTAIRLGNKPPVTLFHFQVLHPIKNGKVRVSLTSGNFHVPVGGNPNQITTYHPVNLCVKKGDYVAFNDIGGYKKGSYPKGTPFQVFSSVPNSITNFFSKSGGTNNGDSFKGTAHAGEELLMRMVLATGTDSNSICR